MWWLAGRSIRNFRGLRVGYVAEVDRVVYDDCGDIAVGFSKGNERGER
jgi:hypothetical protein